MTEPQEGTPAPEQQTTVEDFLLDLGGTLIALKKKGIGEANAVKLIDIGLGFEMARRQMDQSNSGFPFPVNVEPLTDQEGN